MINRNGNKIANQFIIIEDNFTIFQSYNSIIAKKWHNGKIELSEHYDYSMTTKKYLNLFLGINISEVRSKIESGEISISLKV